MVDLTDCHHTDCKKLWEQDQERQRRQEQEEEQARERERVWQQRQRQRRQMIWQGGWVNELGHDTDTRQQA